MKRIILCADGTWNEPEKKDSATGRLKPTNVLKVARAVVPRSSKGVEQVLYYHEGVGIAGGIDKISGGAFGKGMARNVRALYRFLVHNFQPEDQLYFFGFSRGAFTVRTLAGFMRKVGLLEKSDEFYTPELYKLYQSRVKADSAAWQHAFRNVKNPRPCPQILFVGVWDTVGALGAPGFLGQFVNRNKYKYHDIDLHPDIKHAYQALAIDEQRKPFAPSIWTRPSNWNGVLEQAWFPGVHSNVGGGYHPDGLANEALQWIVRKAEDLGLEFDRQFLKNYGPYFNSTLNDSMTPMYRLMRPRPRQIGLHTSDGEAIHQSTIDRINLKECNYDPANLRQVRNELPVINTSRIGRGTNRTLLD